MDYTAKDLEILRPLAGAYAEFALADRCRRIENEYRKLNSLNRVRPPVLVFEVPWGELDKQEPLVLQCEGVRARKLENDLRMALYQKKHFLGDYVVPPYYPIYKAYSSTSKGVEVSETTIDSTTGSSIQSHAYADVLRDEEDLAKFKIPVYSLREEETAAEEDFVRRVFDGLMPTRRIGHQFYFASWDEIPRYHGVENTLIDLYDRPEFMHACMEFFTQMHESQIDQFEKLGLLEAESYYLHCTPALVENQPLPDENGNYKAKDVWCRAMAQLFGSVSPEMHEEFDLQYTQRLFDRCRQSYYGCCEPLHNKIDHLRRFKNLRRISVTPWADPDIAADNIGSDYVMSCKPNPAFVAGSTFDPEPVRKEIRRYMTAAKRNNTPCEFIIKDISTVSCNVDNLTQWVKTVNETIDEFD